MSPEALRLYLVSDRQRCPHDQLERLLPALIDAGVTAVQLRDKSADTRTLVETARRWLAVCRPRQVPLIVNDRADVALAAGADGVHIGDSDLSPADARRLLGPRAVIGVSVGTGPVADEASYGAASPVFSTPTKPDAASPVGLDGLAALRARTRKPLVAIGGIGLSEVADVLAAGADGVAVVSAILGADDPVAAVAALRQRIDAHLRPRSAIPIALTVAGSDSGGGAGVQADLKTMSALGVYGATAITAVTAQNTRAVTAVHELPADMVRAQIDAVFDDLAVAAVKVGMLASAPIADAVADRLAAYAGAPVVIDPVMVAKAGARLLDDSAVATVRRRLLPLATVLTPNLPEAAALLGGSTPMDPEAMLATGRALAQLGPRWVLVKGGHLGPPYPALDVLVGPGEPTWFEAPRIDSRHTHGTGCTLSAAITALLAHGLPVEAAVRAAKAYLSGAIAAAPRLAVGAGHGPVHHFFELWSAESGQA